MSFRFETILRLNKNREELLQKDMGQINTLIQKQKDSQSFIKEVMENKKHELNQKKRGNIDLETMILYDSFFSGTKIHKKRQDTIISEIKVKMEDNRGEVIAAMKKRQTLETLKNHYLLKKRKFQEKKDIAIQDEIASNLWKRNF